MSNRIGSHVSGNDAIVLLDIIHECLTCRDLKIFTQLFDELQWLIPFEFAVAGYAELDNNGFIKAHDIVNISYPDEWLRIYRAREFHKIDALVKKNLSSFSPQYWEETYREYVQPKEITSIADDFGLKSGYTHGEKTIGIRNEVSLFSFASRNINYEDRTKAILECVIPHMHQALSCSLQQKPAPSQNFSISPREKDVLNWIKYGKSSWDISVILGISERTVNFHIYNIMQKLGAVNRPQAVAIAGRHGLIDFD